jgi:hypothetical protein
MYGPKENRFSVFENRAEVNFLSIELRHEHADLETT